MGYKVGDRVRVRSDLEVGKIYGDETFVSYMREQLGKAVTIAKRLQEVAGYKIMEDCFTWTNEMFEGLAEPEHIKAYVNSLTELEEIPPEPKPVPFMEAVKAYSEGKTVKCSMGNHTYTPHVVSGESSSAFSDECHLAPSAQEILHGKWYIID